MEIDAKRGPLEITLKLTEDEAIALYYGIGVASLAEWSSTYEGFGRDLNDAYDYIEDIENRLSSVFSEYGVEH